MTHFATDDHDNSRQLRIALLACDNQNSVLIEYLAGRANHLAYSAYGHQSAPQEVTTCIGFNGELREAQTSWYFLGNGYRVYNPTLMRFHSPDSWSPFGNGGLNAYMYCVGDPVNYSDPTGHVGLFKFFTGPSNRLTRASSSSSLSPLIPNTSQAASATNPVATLNARIEGGITNPNFIDKGATPIYENIPIITGMTPRKEVPYRPITPRYGKEIPPPIPLKQKPRFNDSGGQMGIISPNWIPSEPRRYREAWKSEPFQFPYAPVPPQRSLPGGATRSYSVKYDPSGRPTQYSVERIGNIRSAK